MIRPYPGKLKLNVGFGVIDRSMVHRRNSKKCCVWFFLHMCEILNFELQMYWLCLIAQASPHEPFRQPQFWSQICGAAKSLKLFYASSSRYTLDWDRDLLGCRASPGRSWMLLQTAISFHGAPCSVCQSCFVQDWHLGPQLLWKWHLHQNGSQLLLLSTAAHSCYHDPATGRLTRHTAIIPLIMHKRSRELIAAMQIAVSVPCCVAWNRYAPLISWSLLLWSHGPCRVKALSQLSF